MVACRNASLQPVDIEATDMCAKCKMAISEKRYAAEAIDNDGNVYKFDNINCMLRYIFDRKLRSNIAAYYAADYDTHAWVDARKAAHVKSADIPSPMAGGLASFREANKAAAFAVERHGKVIAFEDLWTSAQ